LEAHDVRTPLPGGTLKKQLGEPTMMPDWEKDAAAGKLILERAGLEVFHSPLHLEGGSIHTDGEGCVVFSPYLLPCKWGSCWLDLRHLHNADTWSPTVGEPGCGLRYAVAVPGALTRPPG